MQFFHFFRKIKVQLIINMTAAEKAKMRAFLELFYGQNTSINKKNETYHQFKGCKVNGRPIYTKPYQQDQKMY